MPSTWQEMGGWSGKWCCGNPRLVCCLATAVPKSLLLHGLTAWSCSRLHAGLVPCQGRSPNNFNQGNCKVLLLGRDNARQQQCGGLPCWKAARGWWPCCRLPAQASCPLLQVQPRGWHFFSPAWKGLIFGRRLLLVPWGPSPPQPITCSLQDFPQHRTPLLHVDSTEKAAHLLRAH